MKLECIKSKLKNLINVGEKITAKNHSLPIINLIILEADKNGLKIKSTNLEVGLEAYLPAKVSLEGVVAVNAQIFNQLLNSTSEDKIFLETINNNLIIKSNKSETSLKTYSAEEFPIIPTINNGQKFNIDVQDFISGVKAVIYSSATSDIKPEIASVYFYQQGGKLYFVATDSFRLAEKNIKFDGKNINPIIIPLKNILEIVKALESEVGEIEITTSENQIAFNTANFYLTSRVINSVFPDYQQIMPKSSKTEVEVSKEELLNSLRLASIFTDKFNQVTFTITPSQNLFEINSRNQEVGENKAIVNSVVSGEDIIINLNGRYILEALPYFHDSKIIISLTEKNRPILLKGKEDSGFRYLVMPINR